jgi:predicted dehydrogenase
MPRPPALNYQPRGPRHPKRHKIGLIGCGGISQYHLTAAKSFGVEVVAMADPNLEAAAARADEFFPRADIYRDHRDLLARDDVTVVDIATHTDIRADQIPDALKAGKHVLSQKPFVSDLKLGRKLVNLARRRNLKLGVNQNARWAPHFAALHAAVARGLLGDIHTLDMVMEWDHTWIRGTRFTELPHVILSDYAIHWFDAATAVFGDRKPRTVFANAVKAPGQHGIKHPMLANAVVNYSDGLATLAFSAYETRSEMEYLCCVGSKGTYRGLGRINRLAEAGLTTNRGTFRYELEGAWFPDGFRGTLGEFLRSIEEDREPTISASGNLRSLALCNAAVESADTGEVVKVV